MCEGLSLTDNEKQGLRRCIQSKISNPELMLWLSATDVHNPVQVQYHQVADQAGQITSLCVIEVRVSNLHGLAFYRNANLYQESGPQAFKLSKVSTSTENSKAEATYEISASTTDVAPGGSEHSKDKDDQKSELGGTEGASSTPRDSAISSENRSHAKDDERSTSASGTDGIESSDCGQESKNITAEGKRSPQSEVSDLRKVKNDSTESGDSDTLDTRMTRRDRTTPGNESDTSMSLTFQAAAASQISACTLADCRRLPVDVWVTCQLTYVSVFLDQCLTLDTIQEKNTPKMKVPAF
ncbi:hypothetical protein BaRGS_00017563 [Batillaria attramentaria]|uniref:Uncharacterized protein n=1 Tax=Batillaria attramentaria TaxID=370345 RepID=A0ABD0KV18_9CAEN